MTGWLYTKKIKEASLKCCSSSSIMCSTFKTKPHVDVVVVVDVRVCTCMRSMESESEQALLMR